MQISKTQIGLFVALLLGNAIVLFCTSESWDGLRLVSALGLTFVLPGWAWLPAVGWMHTAQAVERSVLIIGLSSLLLAGVLFLTVLLPGPFTQTPVLIGLNLLSLFGIIYQSLPFTKDSLSTAKPTLEWPSRPILIILLLILAVAAFTRLTRLGYAEFHEDELENMRLIVRAYKGEEYAPFLDSKGPIHWLLPAALWYLNGWVNEGIARAPFAITALLLIPTMYVLGRRLSAGRESVGLLAAGFVGMNGFFVALARHVENRSLIVFWGALAMWFAYRYYKEDINHFLFYVALTLAIGLIAHPNMLLYLPAFAFLLLVKTLKQDTPGRRLWPWLAGAGVLFIGITALFYVPYLNDPNIARVFEYFAGERVGESLLYNRVDNMLGEDELYNSRFHAPVLILLLLWLVGRNFARLGWRGWTLLIGQGGLIISTVVFPAAWVVDNLNLAFLPYALLTLILVILPRTTFEIKIAFLWFSVPFGALLFLAQDASNHIQIAYTGWALLAAFGLADLWLFLSPPGEGRTFGSMKRANVGLKLLLIVVLITTAGLVLYYQYLSFNATVTTYWRIKAEAADNPGSIYNRIYRSIPRPRKIISNPRLGGWKAVGYLREHGLLAGDFRSINESFAVPIWYTFQTPRSCYDDPQHYWLRRDWQGWPEEEPALIERGYTLTRVILVDQEPKLHLYEKNGLRSEPEIIDMEAYRNKFDHLATPERFGREQTGARKTTFIFGGEKLRLTGYDLPASTGHWGNILPVTVYWESLAPMDVRYRAFMHLVDGNGSLWGQHDDDPACRLLTTDMRPGQHASRQFRLPVDPNAPPGDYSIIFGLYDPNTLERLEIWDAQAKQSLGTSLVLGQVRLE